MAVVALGSLPPLVDASLPRTAFPQATDRCRIRYSGVPDAALTWLRRDSPCSAAVSPFPFLFLTAISITGGGGEGEGRVTIGGAASRRRCSSKAGAAAADFDGSEVGEDDGNSGDGGDEEMKDWEVEMRTRLRELEEMRELEKRAEELQSRAREEEEGGVEGGGGGQEETEEEKRNRVRRELEKLAKEQAERRETAKLMFELGQKAYGKGMYGRAIEFLEGALTIIPRPTHFGGEIQIWLAMAYEANNRHRDCIALYKELEKSHPSVSIRRQAAELCYILQAPKLKISKDEMVTIPLIGSSYDSYAGTWSDKYKDQERRRKATTSQSPPSENFWGDFITWRPPSGWEKNRAFWLAVTLWLGLLGVALLIQS